ncbi:MAG: glycosyltransferase family 2 protein [Xenococcaceae cyanobacterium MO_188.B32]|nr:glycosyltransferase family 2 protein [Xenococcaceae cyanobacterium MO_188.B32]
MISVITPVYNGEKFIESCLKNVIEQSCSNCEHIIVDGASTDDTVVIIREYARQYSHIRWISEPDRGQSDAMNKGIKMAEGEIISILNVDDFYAPNALNRVSAIFSRLPKPSLLVGNCNIRGNNDKIKEVNKPNRLGVVKLIARINPFPLNPSAYFYHKSLHQQIGLYKTDEHYMMDLDFLIKAVQKAHVKYVDEVWGNHRQIEGTKTVTLFQNGEHEEYIVRFLAEHRQNLPWYHQLHFLLVDIQVRIAYFSRHPDELLPSINAKFKLLPSLIKKWSLR